MRESASWAFLIVIALMLMIMGFTGRVGVVLGSVLTPDIVQVLDASGKPVKPTS